MKKSVAEKAPPTTRTLKSSRTPAAANTVTPSTRAAAATTPPETTPTATTSNLRPVTTTLPRSHHQIIETEASALGLKKNQFLSMLVRREAGLVSLNRMGPSPKYEFTGEDLSTVSRYVWLVPPDTYAQFEEQCLGRGGITAQPYLIQLLHDWIGKPRGFKKDSDGKFR